MIEHSTDVSERWYNGLLESTPTHRTLLTLYTIMPSSLMVNFPTCNVGGITISVKVGSLLALGGKGNKADWPHWTLGMVEMIFWNQCWDGTVILLVFDLLQVVIYRKGSLCWCCGCCCWWWGRLLLLVPFWLLGCLFDFCHGGAAWERRTQTPSAPVGWPGLGFSWRSGTNACRKPGGIS